MGTASPPPPPPPSEEEIKRREEKKKINSQREKIFEEILLQLNELKENCPNALAVEKEKCGRPTYIKNYSSTFYCPKCGGGVQQFIENKLVRIINSRNQIYPLYSDNNCLTYESDQVRNSKFKIREGVAIKIKQEENGDGYIQINGNKYYFTFYAKNLYNSFKTEYEKNPFGFLENVITITIGNEHKEKLDIFSLNSCYDYYYYENPLRNFSSAKVMKYYRCIKCHFEYHLYTPSYTYYLNLLKLKEKEENKEENGNNEKEKENQEIKNE